MTIATDAGSTETGGKPIEEGDERSFHAFHTVARREIEKHSARIGERIGVKYLGKAEGKGGVTYDSYKVAWAEPHRQATLPLAEEPPAAEEDQEEGDDGIPF